MRIALLGTGKEISDALHDLATTHFSLVGPLPDSVVDHDVFVADPQMYQQPGQFHQLKEMAVDILQKVMTGGVLVMFSSRQRLGSQYGWIPLLTLTGITNSTSHSLQAANPEIDKLFRDVMADLYSECYFQISSKLDDYHCLPLFYDSAHRTVGLLFALKKGALIMLPRCQKMSVFVRKVLIELLPHVIEDFDVFTQRPERFPWQQDVEEALPGIQDIDQRIEEKSRQKGFIEEELSQLHEARIDLTDWVDLVSCKGKRLEEVVFKAFRFLGLNPKHNPIGVHGPGLLLDTGRDKFIVEIEGSDSCIDKDKGRQLLDWVTAMDADHNIIGTGLLVGNPHRKEHPENRPPSSQKRNFTVPFVSLAERHHFGLIWTKHLLELVRRKLACEEVPTETIIQLLREAHGLVHFGLGDA